MNFWSKNRFSGLKSSFFKFIFFICWFSSVNKKKNIHGTVYHQLFIKSKNCVYSIYQQFIIGDIGYLFSEDVGLFYDHYGMMFLYDCYNKRCKILK